MLTALAFSAGITVLAVLSQAATAALATATAGRLANRARIELRD